MTKSTITREESVQTVFDLKAGYRLGFADIEILKRVARMALAAMDSEPDCKERKLFCSTDTTRMRKTISVSAGTEDAPLYRHPQPAPVVPDDVLEALQKVARIRLDLNAFDGDHRGLSFCLSDAEETLIDVVNRRADMFADAMQSPGGDHATVPGKWIPVSERMPPSRHEVLVGSWWGEKPRWCCKWATYIPGHPDAQSSGWLIPGASWTPTHWMPLPSAPQDFKS